MAGRTSAIVPQMQRRNAGENCQPVASSVTAAEEEDVTEGEVPVEGGEPVEIVPGKRKRSSVKKEAKKKKN